MAWRYSIGAEFDYEIKQNVRKAHKYSINPGLDYFYSEQVFGRAKLDYSYNFLAADYKNIDVSMGPGFSFFKDRDELRLELMALVGVKKAYFRGDEFLLALLGQGESIRFRFASLDYDYQYQLPATALEWYAKGSILKMLDQPIELLDFKYEVHNEMGVRYWLTDKIRLSWSVQHDWTGIDLVLSDGTVHPVRYQRHPAKAEHWCQLLTHLCLAKEGNASAKSVAFLVLTCLAEPHAKCLWQSDFRHQLLGYWA